jgi:hypothetical protein
VVPELRNAYLEDFGLMAVTGPAEVLVLVDIGTGRQYLGEGLLGVQLRAPGGGPLPKPSVAPSPAGTITPVISPASEPGGLWQLPNEDPKPGLLSSPFVYLVAGMFLFAWVGYAVVAVTRRFRLR